MIAFPSARPSRPPAPQSADLALEIAAIRYADLIGCPALMLPSRSCARCGAVARQVRVVELDALVVVAPVCSRHAAVDPQDPATLAALRGAAAARVAELAAGVAS